MRSTPSARCCFPSNTLSDVGSNNRMHCEGYGAVERRALLQEIDQVASVEIPFEFVVLFRPQQRLQPNTLRERCTPARPSLYSRNLRRSRGFSMVRQERVMCPQKSDFAERCLHVIQVVSLRCSAPCRRSRKAFCNPELSSIAEVRERHCGRAVPGDEAK